MSSWSSRIFNKSAPVHNRPSGFGGFGGFGSSPAPQQITPDALPLPPHLRPPSSASAASSAAPSRSHPYSMVSTPHQHNSAHDMDDEGECPVCLEPLSFSFRLPGEKPHIVPECGHALHEVYHPVYLSRMSLELTHSPFTRISRPASAPSMVLLPHPVVLGSPASPTWAYAVYADVQ